MPETTGATAIDGSTARRRRYLTILFADLSDSTRLAETLEAEHYAEALNAFRQACRQIVPQHGGRIAQLLGDGAVAIFGYPEPHEHDGRRAAEAALELHEAVKQYRVPGPAPDIALRLHSGIHSGLVLLGEGDIELGRFELLGTVPNIAARLAAAAQQDQIIVSAETLGPERYCFDTSELRFLTLKGMAAPLAVYRIHGRGAAHTRLEASAHRGLLPLIGRQEELRVLDLHLKEVLQARARWLVISAPPGLGKSRIAAEFLRHAAEFGCQVHRGYCENELSAVPLQPFIQMLRALFGLEDVASSQAGERIASALSAIDPRLMAYQAELMQALSLSGSTERPDAERTVEAFVVLFQRLAATRPQVVFIDDWQWADTATRQVFRALVALESASLFALLSTRANPADDADLNGAKVIELAPFTKGEAAETIARLLPATDPFVVDEIYKYSGGNPLFIEELCHSAAQEGETRSLRGHKSAAWLNTLVESRVARLPSEQAELVRVAAVIGNVIPAWLLQTITGYDEHHALVRGLADHDFVFPGERDGILRFKHGITRDVVYEAVGLHRREALHLRIAETLERHSAATPEEYVEVLAYHYGASGKAAQAARFAELAGDKAVKVSAIDRAKAQYRAALVALDKLEPTRATYQRWLGIAYRLGLACVFDASREDLEVFRRAAEIAEASGDQPTIARTHYWLGYISYALGDVRPALQHSETALRVARRLGDDPLIVQIRATLGQARAAASDYDLALNLLDEAIVVKRKHRSGARPAVGFAYSLTCKAHVLGDRGLFQQAHECFDEALTSVSNANHEVEASIRGWQSAVFLWQGRWEEALHAAEAAHRIGARVRSLFSFSMSYAAGAYASWMLERTASSLEQIENATAWLEPRGVQLFHSLNYGWLADGMVTLKRAKELRYYGALALRRARQADLLGVAMAYRSLARQAAEAQRWEEARHYLERASGIANARGSAHETAVTQLQRAELELACGAPALARPLLDVASAAFERMSMSRHLEAAQRLSNRA